MPEHHCAGARDMNRRPDLVEQNEIRERQERAWHLVVVRRLSEQEAAQILQVSDRTVRRDLNAMRARGRRGRDQSRRDGLRPDRRIGRHG